MPLFLTSIRLAVRALRRNTLRTALTMLGMVIGVGAVVTMMALGKGGMRPDVARAVVGNVAGLEKVTLEQLAKTLDRASKTMTALLAGIAGVSLLVGGIGIMNIMLVSVIERTREIGLRMAVGARRQDILLQFLMEAVVLSTLAGLIGIGLGAASAFAMGWFLHWPILIAPASIGASFFFSCLVGVFFGFYPAMRASRLDPIEALRYE